MAQGSHNRQDAGSADLISGTAPVRAFISYSHEDAQHKAMVVRFWTHLRSEGIDARMDVTAANDRRFWAGWMSDQIRHAQFVLVIASPGYRQKAEESEDPSYGRGVQWESRQIQNLLYEEGIGGHKRIIPVVLPGSRREDLPDWILPAAGTVFVLDEITSNGTDALLRLLTNQPLYMEPALGQVVRRPPLEHHGPGADGPEPVSVSGKETGMPVDPDWPKVWNVPARNPYFVGRVDLLTDLHHGQRSGGDACRVSTLHGLGGVGKTQLAIEFAHRYAADYSLVWWVDADALIPDQLVTLAKQLKLPLDGTAYTVGREVLRDLARRRDWLLIVDNVEHFKDVADLRPHGAGGHVIMTTRGRRGGAMGRLLEVGVLDPTETIELLQRRIPEVPQQLAGEIAEELGHLPLAAAQAAAYIEQSDMSAPDYLRRVKLHNMRLLDRGDVLDYKARVDTTWLLSLENLRATSPPAVALLELSAFLGTEPIPLTLFTARADLLEEPLRTLAADPDDLSDVVGEAVGLSLATRRDDGYQMHLLLQEVIRHRLTQTQRDVAIRTVTTLLYASQPGPPNNSTHSAAFARLSPHILAMGPLLDSSDPGRELTLAALVYLRDRGDTRVSRIITEDVLQRYQRVLGRDHQDTLSAAANLILALVWVGEGKGAVKLGDAYLYVARTRLGRDHDCTLRLAANLILALAWFGNWEQARDLGKDTLNLCRSRQPPVDDHITLTTAANLASTLGWIGELEEAEALGRETLAAARSRLGKNHLITLIAAAALGLAHIWRGQLAEAEALTRDSTDRATKALGADHPTTFRVASGLCFTLVWVGKTQEALSLSQEYLERSSRTLGATNRITLVAAAAEGFALLGVGDFERIRDVGPKTLVECQNTLGPDHPISHIAAATLTFALTGWEGGHAAVEIGRRSVDSAELVLGVLHQVTLMSATALAFALAASGATDEARTTAGQTAQRSRKMLGNDHPITLLSAAAVTLAAAGGGDTSAIRADGLNNLRRCQTVLGRQHPITLAASTAQVLLLAGAGEDEQANDLAAATVDLCRRVLGRENTITGSIIRVLGPRT